jgi:hypothetical protein
MGAASPLKSLRRRLPTSTAATLSAAIDKEQNHSGVTDRRKRFPEKIQSYIHFGCAKNA